MAPGTLAISNAGIFLYDSLNLTPAAILDDPGSSALSANVDVGSLSTGKLLSDLSPFFSISFVVLTYFIHE